MAEVQAGTGRGVDDVEMDATCYPQYESNLIKSNLGSVKGPYNWEFIGVPMQILGWTESFFYCV